MRFHARVAANVAGIVGRQLALGPVHEARYPPAWPPSVPRPRPPCAQPFVPATTTPGTDALHALLATSVRDRLAVANPRHLGR